MTQPPAPEFVLDAFADPSTVRDVVSGILHTIFFHRYFPSLLPETRDVLDLTLPHVAEPELDTMIDQRTTTLMRQLDSDRQRQQQQQQQQQPQPQYQAQQQRQSHARDDLSLANAQYTQGRQAVVAETLVSAGPGGGAAGSVGSSGGGGRGQITIQFFEKKRKKAWIMRGDEDVCWESWVVKVTVAEPRTESERAKVRKATESTLHNTVMKIVTLVNTHKDHIPPITTTEVNPFPYQITVNQKEGGWATRMGIYS